MGLLDTMKKVAENTNAAGAPTAWFFGKVTKTSPLTIRVDNRFDISGEAIVVPKELQAGYYPTHYHTGMKGGPSTEEKGGGSGEAAFASHSHVLKNNYQTNTDKTSEYYTRTHKKGARASAGTSIEHRPEEVNARTTVGHWEMDSVLGKKKTKPALLVLSERLSRKELIIKVQDHTAASVVRALDRLERKMGSPAFRATFKSITVDNGSEFADVEGMERSCRRKGARTKVYYCHPYSSWERGTNENTNGLIRRWFPKGTDFSKVSVQEIQKVEDWLNAYPREILGFLSADAVFSTAFAACV